MYTTLKVADGSGWGVGSVKAIAIDDVYQL